jgi:hypothetical protein
MLKKFLRKYLEIPESPPRIEARLIAAQIVEEVKKSEWFIKYHRIAVEKAISEELRDYKYEVSGKAKLSALEAVSFIKDEAFIDGIVERIKKKQL